jgi:hypothetical protein
MFGREPASFSSHQLPHSRGRMGVGASDQWGMAPGRGWLVPMVDLAWRREGLRHVEPQRS